eukprot:13670686-Alexandrium_andersonii.AAC.1
MSLTTHAQTPFNSKQRLFFPSGPNWPSSLSLARAYPGERASRTAPGANWAPGAGRPQASRAATLP